MHAHRHRTRRGHIPLNQGDMFGIGNLVDVDHRAELAAMRTVQLGLGPAFHISLRAPAVFDQIGYGADLQAMGLGKLYQIGHPRHGAVIVHNFANHAGGRQAGQAGDIYRRLSMAGAYQDTAVTGHQGKNMARRRNIPSVTVGIDRNSDGPRPISGGNAGGNPVPRLNRNSKGSTMPGFIALRHEGQAQLLHPFAIQ